MILLHVMGVEIREERKEEERPLLAWRTALRMQDNMGYRGSVDPSSTNRKETYFLPQITDHPELIQIQNGYKVADYPYNQS